METRIPDGAYCLFSYPVEGSRQERLALAQHRGITDPDQGGTYTVRRYRSKKSVNENESLEHFEVILEPLYLEFDPLVFKENAEELEVVAEVAEVLGKNVG